MPNQATPQTPPSQLNRFSRKSPRQCGVRPQAEWQRKWRAPKCEALAKLDGQELLAHVHAVHRHTAARNWREADHAARAELRRRAWDVGTLSRMPLDVCPRWVKVKCYLVTATGQRRHRKGWGDFIGWLISAFRGGAIGLIGNYEALAAELGVSRATFARYVAEMVEAGLIRVEHTYQDATKVAGVVNRKRCNDTNLYQLGPLLLQAWHALLVGVDCGEAGPSEARTKYAAREQDVKARRARRALELHNRKTSPGARASRPAAQPTSTACQSEILPGPKASVPARLPKSKPVATKPAAAGGRANERPPSLSKSHVETTTRPAARDGWASPTHPVPGMGSSQAQEPTPSAPAEFQTDTLCSSAAPTAACPPAPNEPGLGKPRRVSSGASPREPGSLGEQTSGQHPPPETPHDRARTSTRHGAAEHIQAELRRVAARQGHADGVPEFLRTATPAALISMGYAVDAATICRGCNGHGKKSGTRHGCRSCGETGRC